MDTEFEIYVENAIRWAHEKIGSNDYLFKCLAFVEDAYEESNCVEIFGGDSAKESAVQYEAYKNIGFPPIGAFVFYDASGTISGECKNFGHVGIHIGNGDIVHAWDKVRVDNYMDVENLSAAPGWTKPKYLGWSPVDRIFKGYIKKTGKIHS